MICLGIDTSNYTTSLALYDDENNSVTQRKKLLPVKSGQRGLRQSDAVFSHTQQVYPLLKEILSDKRGEIRAVGVSDRPRSIDGSYMPCFTVGLNTAECIGAALNVPVYRFSHQMGHIAAALFSSGHMELINREFIAFHVSGGTTEALLVRPDEDNIISCEIIGGSSDLKAGQAIDRIGVLMGLSFPCGRELDRLACESTREYRIKPTVKEGFCSLSGVENKCMKMLSENEKYEDTAKFCIEYIMASLDGMAEYLLKKYGDMPLLFSGGVMSNSIIKRKFTEKYGAFFAESDFSSDNAAGTAILTCIKETGKWTEF